MVARRVAPRSERRECTPAVMRKSKLSSCDYLLLSCRSDSVWVERCKDPGFGRAIHSSLSSARLPARPQEPAGRGTIRIAVAISNTSCSGVKKKERRVTERQSNSLQEPRLLLITLTGVPSARVFPRWREARDPPGGSRSGPPGADSQPAQDVQHTHRRNG